MFKTYEVVWQRSNGILITDRFVARSAAEAKRYFEDSYRLWLTGGKFLYVEEVIRDDQ